MDTAGILRTVTTYLFPDQSPVLQVAGDLQWVYLFVGLALVVAVGADLLWTTLWADGGAGPLTTSLMEGTWRILRRFGERRSKVLSLSGPLVLLLTLAMWVTLIWAGWTLVFASGPNALNYTRGAEPVSWVGRLYFVAYTLFTLGNGDFSPTSGTWRIATALTNGSGMVLITLSVTYVVNVLQAVVKKRSFASSVQGVAKRSEKFAISGWDGADFAEHDLPLDTFSSQLSTIASQHKAYPILHYYRSSSRQHAAPIATAILDDALTLLRFGVAPEARPNEPLLETARSSTEDYLQSVYSLPVQPTERAPAAPDLARLREEGVPTVSDERFGDAVEGLEDRRRRLRGIVDSQSWRWPSVDDAEGDG